MALYGFRKRWTSLRRCCTASKLETKVVSFYGCFQGNDGRMLGLGKFVSVNHDGKYILDMFFFWHGNSMVCQKMMFGIPWCFSFYSKFSAAKEIRKQNDSTMYPQVFCSTNCLEAPRGRFCVGAFSWSLQTWIPGRLKPSPGVVVGESTRVSEAKKPLGTPNFGVFVCHFLPLQDIPYLYVDPNLPHRNVASDFVLPLPLGVVDWKTLQANVSKVQNERSGGRVDVWWTWFKGIVFSG